MNNEFFDLQLFAEDSAPETSAPSGSAPEPDKKGEDHVTFTPEQQAYIDQLVDRTFAKASKKAAEKARKEAEEDKEAEKLKNLSEAERNAKRMKDMEERIAAFEREKTETAMMTAARDELRQRGYSFPDTIVSRLIGDDAEATKASIDDFTKAYEKSVQEAVKKAVPSTEPKKGTANKMTTAEIMKVKNRAERQKLIAENIELFQK